MKRIPSLDGLRAVSILLVIVGHASYSVHKNSWVTDSYAHAGVIVFFVISGYLITTLILKDVAREQFSVSKFYGRRAWRILPVAYLYLAVVTTIGHSSLSWRDIALSWTYLSDFSYYFGHVPWNLVHLWSLSVEEQFYLLWPLVIVAFGIGRARLVLWGCVLGAPFFRYAFAKHGLNLMALFSFPGVVDSIATGCLFAIYSPKVSKWAGFAWLPAALLPLVGGVHILGKLQWTLFDICVGVGMMWAIDVAPKALNHAAPVWIGTLSYSLYLWHVPFLNPALHLGLVLRLSLAFAATIASYYFVERPALAIRSQSFSPDVFWRRA